MIFAKDKKRYKLNAFCRFVLVFMTASIYLCILADTFAPELGAPEKMISPFFGGERGPF